MAWTSPMTFVDGTALTASQLNTHLRDNLLETMPALATTAGEYFMSSGKNKLNARQAGKDTILTLETCSSTDWNDLATVGPQVTLETGSSALILFGAGFSGQTSAGATAGYVSVEVAPQTDDAQTSGNTIAPDDSYALIYQCNATTDEFCGTHHVTHFNSLTPGSNTFTLKYRSSSGNTNFNRRRISVMPLD
jgi:hypothetical protein